MVTCNPESLVTKVSSTEYEETKHFKRGAQLKPSTKPSEKTVHRERLRGWNLSLCWFNMKKTVGAWSVHVTSPVNIKYLCVPRVALMAKG